MYVLDHATFGLFAADNQDEKIASSTLRTAAGFLASLMHPVVVQSSEACFTCCCFQQECHWTAWSLDFGGGSALLTFARRSLRVEIPIA